MNTEKLIKNIHKFESDIEGINSSLDTITIIAPKTNDVISLQSFLDTVPNNVNLKFPKYIYYLTDVLVIKNKFNITINANDTTFNSTKHGYGCIELFGCENVEWNGGKFIGKGNFPINAFNGDVLSNEKEDYKSVWGFRRNGDSKSTPIYNDGYLGNCGIGLLVNQGCKNVIVNNVEGSLFNFSAIAIGFRGNGDIGWGNINNVVESKNIKIKNCYCHDNFSSGILVCQVDGFEISSNKVENNGHPNATSNDLEVDPGYGITCTGTWYHAKNGKIINNISLNNKRKGIEAHAGENILIENNTVDGSIVQGIAVVTNNATNERLLDFKILNNTVLNSGNGTNIKLPINFGIIVQGNNTSEIKNNTVKNCANKTGAYAIQGVDGTKIITDNTVIDSGNGCSIRNYGTVAITSNNTIKSDYETLVMSGDSGYVKITDNVFNSNFATGTAIYINGATTGIISGNVSNKKSIVSFGVNTSNVEIGVNKNIAIAGNVVGKGAIAIPKTYSFKIFTDSSGAVTCSDYSKNIVRDIQSDTNGVRINFNIDIKDVSINVTTSDSSQANKIQNIYLRSIYSNSIIIGLGATLTDLGRPIENFKSTNFIITMTTYE